MHCDEVYCPSEIHTTMYKQYFSIANPKLIIRNQPRVEYARKNQNERKILYAPTYRKYEDINNIIDSLGIIDNCFLNFLESKNVKLVFRPHPIDRKYINHSITSEYIEFDETSDIYESITKYKVAITDYSSLFYDCNSLGIKCILLANDFYEYFKNVGLTDNFTDHFNTNGFKHANETIKYLELIFNN